MSLDIFGRLLLIVEVFLVIITIITILYIISGYICHKNRKYKKSYAKSNFQELKKFIEDNISYIKKEYTYDEDSYLVIIQSNFEIQFNEKYIYFKSKQITPSVKNFFIILGFIDYLKYIFYLTFILKRMIKKHKEDENNITEIKPLDFISNKN